MVLNMNGYKQKHLKKVIGLILLLFAVDNLAVWDLVEISVFDRPGVEVTANMESHLHDAAGTGQHTEATDTCVFCPCCVAGLNMVISSFAFSTNLDDLSYLFLSSPPVDGRLDHTIFHPPQIIS